MFAPSSTETWPGERRAVRHNHVVAEDAVVRDVGLGHNQAVVAGRGQAAAALRAAMDGDELADAVAPPDARLGRLALVLQILRGQADGDEGEDVRVVADSGAPVNDAVRFQAHAVAQCHFVADDAVGADVAVASRFARAG